MISRREMLIGSLSVAAFRNDTLDLVANAIAKTTGEIDARDEEFWAQIQEAFMLDRNLANFNNGGCSPSPRIVFEAMQRQLEFSNQAPSNYMWRILEPEIESVRSRLAKLFACDTEEIAITRNASESLENLIFGMELHAGDEVVITNLDYPRMVTSVQQRERRDGVKMVQPKVPNVPKRPQDLLSHIEAAVTDKTRMIVCSQVSFMNGQIFPIKELVEFARKRNIPVVVDGAHAFVQYKFDQTDLGCDYFGTSLHKWLMAPIGTGFLYINRKKIKEVWPLMAAADTQTDNIRKFEEIGTHPAANHNAIGEAITFHEMIGIERKEARFRYLRHRWTDRLRDEPKVRFYTSLEPVNSCAITTVGIAGIKSVDLAGWLQAKHGVFVTQIVNDFIDGIRVSPNVYSTVYEVDRLGEAMLIACKQGIS